MDISKIKIKLGLADNSQDELLAILLSDATNYMQVYLETPTIPWELEFIAEEVTIKRYRRIGAEGISTEKIDVLSTTYKSDDYKPLMKQYRANNTRIKRLRML